MACDRSSTKLLIVVSNILLYLVCAASLGLAIWVLVDKPLLLQLSNINLQQNMTLSSIDSKSIPEICAIFLISLGLFNFIVGMFGCCGAIKESKNFLCSYITSTIVIILAGLIIITISVIFIYNHVELHAKNYLGYTLSNYYVGLPHSLNANNETIIMISKAWDFAHILFKCCGLNGPQDFSINGSTSAALWFHEKRSYTFNNTTFRNNQVYIPPTCCEMRNSPDLAFSSSWNHFMDFMNNKKCPITQLNNNKKGCYKAITEQFIQYAITIIVATCLIIAVKIFGLLAACFLKSMIQNKKTKDGYIAAPNQENSTI